VRSDPEHSHHGLRGAADDEREADEDEDEAGGDDGAVQATMPTPASTSRTPKIPEGPILSSIPPR